MKFFLDTANLNEIGQSASFGILGGDTTNPAFAAKIGAHIGPTPYQVFEKLFQHPLTSCRIELFASDWEKARATRGKIVEPAGMRKGAR